MKLFEKNCVVEIFGNVEVDFGVHLDQYWKNSPFEDVFQFKDQEIIRTTTNPRHCFAKDCWNEPVDQTPEGEWTCFCHLQEGVN
jgi:hypothetical protein